MELKELEDIVMDLKGKLESILSKADESEKKYIHDKGLAEFTERNNEVLGKYSDKLKKLNGDDFDVFSAAYDEYNDSFSDIEEATYVTQLVSEIDSKLAKLKEALNDDEVEVKSDEDTTEVTTASTEVAVPAADADADADADAEKDELDEFERMLDEDYEVYKDR